MSKPKKQKSLINKKMAREEPAEAFIKEAEHYRELDQELQKKSARIQAFMWNHLDRITNVEEK